MPTEIWKVRVTPKASSNRIENEKRGDELSTMRVYVTAVPEDGKANKAVIALLSKEFKVPKSAITITHGQTGRDKIICITR